MTPIEFPCPECNARLRIKPENAGKKLRCPRCKAVVQAPAAPADFEPPAPSAPPVPAAPSPSWPKSVPDEGMDFEPAPRKPVKPPADLDEDDDFEPPARKPTAKPAAKPAAPAARQIRPEEEDDDDDRPAPGRAPARASAATPAKKPGPMVAIMVSLIALLYIGALTAVFLGLADTFLLGDVSPRPSQKAGFDMKKEMMAKLKGQFSFKNPNDGDKKIDDGNTMTPEQARQRLQTINDLRQMGLAMLFFHDTHGKGLPPADGEPHASAPNLKGLSWRAHLLPFMEGQKTYQMLLKDDKSAMPWDRPELKKEKVYPFVPSVPGKAREPWHTYYRVFTGPGTAFESKKELKLKADFPDGLSQTILIVEAGEPVPWPKPEELVYDPKKPLPKLGGQFVDGFYAAFADGSVRFIPRATDEKTIRAMITRNGGETIDVEKLLPPVNAEKLKELAGVQAQ
ncbi:MAG: DUF1559 domain-containing protein [Planctomycetes bacterium]|nr:DUF1559 domain-containing protein [Planctomycetota bacterium]